MKFVAIDTVVIGCGAVTGREHADRPRVARWTHAGAINKRFAGIRQCVAARVPVLIGSGVTLDNVDNYAEAADALIVGSHFKTAGRWENALDPARVRALVGRLKSRRR